VGGGKGRMGGRLGRLPAVFFCDSGRANIAMGGLFKIGRCSLLKGPKFGEKGVFTDDYSHFKAGVTGGTGRQFFFHSKFGPSAVGRCSELSRTEGKPGERNR